MSRVELANVFIGVTLLVLGWVSTIAATLRLRHGSATLLTFGFWCTLYGARLLASQPIIGATVGGAPHQWARLVALITYTITVPITMFVASVIGAGWRNSTRWLVGAVTTFALVAIVIDLTSGTAGAASKANSWVVLASVSLGVVIIIHSTATRGVPTLLTDPIVKFGGVVLVLFVINENFGRIVPPGVNIEAIGVLVFIVCLGYAVGRSVFRAEAEFIAVQRELETARQIQVSLLPRRLPKLPGLEVAVRYVPATAVAGDIYDFFEIGPSRLGILVADVMGHGIPAALVASMVKLAFSAQTEHAHDPAAVMTSMNQILCRHLERSYVTAVYAVVDTEQQRVTLANAGHPSPLLRRRGEAAARVEGERGLILGFLPEARYTNVDIECFAVADRILLYSDGMVEARNRRGEFFDASRVADWLSTAEPIIVERLADIALDELTRWSAGGQFEDDVTFVVAEGTQRTCASEGGSPNNGSSSSVT
jgi:phosphoserine phosphatase RsbU/P